MTPFTHDPFYKEMDDADKKLEVNIKPIYDRI